VKLETVIAVLGLNIAACASVSASVTEMPLELDANGHIRVPVTVAGEGPYDFILDTAASSTAVMRPLVEELGWQPLEGEGATVNGTAGAAQIDLFQPVQLGVGSAVNFTPEILPSLNALEITGAPFYGILGSDFFEMFAVEIDAPGQSLRLTEGSSAALIGDGGFASTEMYEIVDGIWALDVMVGDQQITALLDTGARGSVMNRAAAEALGIDLPPSAESNGEEITGAAGHAVRGIGLQVDRISAGDRVWENEQVLVSDLHVFDVLGIADQPAMIFASDLLFQGRLVIDYGRGRIFLGQPEL